MFTPEHEIWKLADAADRLDDWLPYAEGLVDKWRSQSGDEISFSSTWEIITAAFLLKDDLLPASAKEAFARLTLDVISEVTSSVVLRFSLNQACGWRE